MSLLCQLYCERMDVGHRRSTKHVSRSTQKLPIIFRRRALWSRKRRARERDRERSNLCERMENTAYYSAYDPNTPRGDNVSVCSLFIAVKMEYKWISSWIMRNVFSWITLCLWQFVITHCVLCVWVCVCVLKECPKLHVVYRFHSFSDGRFFPYSCYSPLFFHSCQI